MSAQCTDERVNKVAEKLYAKYTSLEDFANADIEELQADIRSTGFYKNKAKNIKASAGILLDEYGGEVPSDIESLTSLPGVGRKTANVVRGNIFGIDSIVVDTHVKRVSNRLGLSVSKDPVKIEYDLMEIIPREYWILINLWFIAFGRKTCRAVGPKCGECTFTKEYCLWSTVNVL